MHCDHIENDAREPQETSTRQHMIAVRAAISPAESDFGVPRRNAAIWIRAFLGA